jgi:hypothetical protein
MRSIKNRSGSFDTESRRINKIIYSLFISSQFNGARVENIRNDDLYITMLKKNSFKVDLVDRPVGNIEWYRSRGFLIFDNYIGGGKYIYLTMDNYREIC